MHNSSGGKNIHRLQPLASHVGRDTSFLGHWCNAQIIQKENKSVLQICDLRKSSPKMVISCMDCSLIWPKSTQSYFYEHFSKLLIIRNTTQEETFPKWQLFRTSARSWTTDYWGGSAPFPQPNHLTFFALIFLVVNTRSLGQMLSEVPW